MRPFFVLIALLALSLVLAETALAQQPITTTLHGVIEDQDPVSGLSVTRVATFTLVYTPVVASPHYTIVFTSTGNDFVLERRATYGDVASGAALWILLVGILFWLTFRLFWRRV